jgi:hypothetical protein
MESLHLHDAILEGQQYIRAARMWRVHVSIRDIMRVIDLYRYFRTTSAGKELIGSSERTSHWKALIISIAMGYYFRLNNESAHNRRKFEQNMNKMLNR